MNKKYIATVGAVVVSFAVSVATSHAAVISQPGESMGVALGAPLPEGVFAVDLESYGKADGAANRIGVNIPLIAWSTPWSFMGSRLEVLYAAPFTHIDGSGPGALNRVDAYSQALLIGLAHDFGNGFNFGVFAGPRPEDNFLNASRGVGADIRASLSYVANGYDATLTFAYSGNFGGVNKLAALGVAFDDNIYIDYTFTKHFDKLEVGIVGFAQTDIGGPIAAHPGSIAIGGLVGYDFGPVTVQGMVTREVAARGVGGWEGLGSKKDTRGWLRLIVPLYVAPKPVAPVVARY
jgi:hypothetical protein